MYVDAPTQVMVDKQYLQKVTAKERSRFEQQVPDMDFGGGGAAGLMIGAGGGPSGGA